MVQAQANGNAIMLQDGLGRPPFSGINLQEVELRFEGFIEEVALVPKPSAEVLVGPLKIVNSKFPGVHPPVFVAKASLWR